MALNQLLWPQYRFYAKEEDVIYSVEHARETYVVAGNKLGKDFTAGNICVNVFLRALKLGLTCKIINTSVKQEHLAILWGEIARFITEARYPLLAHKGGPLVLMHMEVRRASEAESKNPRSYLKGMVSEAVEGMSGHHADVTLFVGDEASGLEDKYYIAAQGWAKRILLFGNPNPCENQFKRGYQAGPLGVGELIVPDHTIIMGAA